MPAPSRSWRRYVALGDSFTEGLSDPDPDRPGEYRGWADRLAGHLAAAQPGADLEYANLAIRGRLLPQVLAEQVPVALAARPDLVSLVAGGNDLLRPGADPDRLAAALEEAVAGFRADGADVLLATGVDPRLTPLIRRTRGRVAVFNASVWSIAARHGAAVLDQWGADWLLDWRLWDGDWRTPLPPAPPRALRAAVAEEVAWVRGFVAPWIARRVRGRSSGDGRAPKRPVPLTLARG